MLAVRAMGGQPQFDLPNLRFKVRFSGTQSSIFWSLGMKSSGIVFRAPSLAGSDEKALISGEFAARPI
jgi:hypothetical protein